MVESSRVVTIAIIIVWDFLAGFELDDVWSIRKNVQVTQASKEGKALNSNTFTSSYSRHGGFSGM